MKDPELQGLPIDDIFPTEVHNTVHDDLEDYDRELRGSRWGEPFFHDWNMNLWYYFPPFLR